MDARSQSSTSQSINMGKVHGSLARAGKVKSQTPKVEKQESESRSDGEARGIKADALMLCRA